MNNTFVVTVIGADRPGLVELLSQTALAQGANWESSRMAHMAGRFAGILVLSVAPEKADALSSALAGLEAQGLRTVIERSGEVADCAGWQRLTLDLVGNDRPGILSEVSRALAERGVNVEELNSQVVSAPMSGDPLFKLTAKLLSPPSVETADLQDLLEGLAGNLMVELSLLEA